MRYYNYSTIVHRFRILVVGKVSVVYHTGRKLNNAYIIAARLWQVLTHQNCF